ncbi:MAG: aminoglycoside phosphotransferase family protein [Clostridia bacterium]|nr:aminoglycoside phosphotransferase family protein [Clostridia bacterium]
MTTPINELQKIAEKFDIQGKIITIKQINKGYINRTYKVETKSEAGHVHKYILQRINTNVFPDVDALMSNFTLTTQHLHNRLVLPCYHKRGTVQTHRPTKDGSLFFHDCSGCWRLLTYFDHVYSMDIPDSPESFYHAGVSFGKFVKEMSDVDINEIKEVIPNFHNTKSRYRDLEAAIERDPKKRVKEVTREIEFIRARADKFGLISDALESGKIPTRICHNDCNLNNILFDTDTHLPVAIIDLDTVMPSSPLYDFGDSMRIGTNTAKDDEKDLSKVSCDLGLYEQYARGYLEACGDVLTKEELELLPYASLIITSEDGIRFLMDHINGDTYYHIYYPGQNLDRSRTQLKLVEDMENKLPEIKQILKQIYADLGLCAQIALV